MWEWSIGMGWIRWLRWIKLRNQGRLKWQSLHNHKIQDIIKFTGMQAEFYCTFSYACAWTRKKNKKKIHKAQGEKWTAFLVHKLGVVERKYLRNLKALGSSQVCTKTNQVTRVLRPNKSRHDSHCWQQDAHFNQRKLSICANLIGRHVKREKMIFRIFLTVVFNFSNGHRLRDDAHKLVQWHDFYSSVSVRHSQLVPMVLFRSNI
jgi:hypothetical protein